MIIGPEDNVPDLTVSVSGTAVKDLWLVAMRIENSGHVEIRTADFEEPFTIRFAKPARVVSAEYVSSSPTGVRAKVSLLDNTITVEPLLLNRRDRVSIQALVTAFHPGRDAIRASARIAGGNGRLAPRSHPRRK